MPDLNKLLNVSVLFMAVFLFVFIPLYPKFPLFNVSGTFVAIRLEDLLIGLTVSLWGIFIITSGKLKFFFKKKINQAITLFFFIGFVSTFSAGFLTHSITLNLGLLHFLRRVELMLLLPVVATIVTTKKQLTLILTVLILTLFVVNLYALGQQYLDWPVVSTTNSEFSKGLILRFTPGARVNSTFAGHYDLAAFLAMALVIMVAIFFAVNKVIKLGLIILIVFTLMILIMAAARLSFIAAFAGILTALLLARKRKYIILIMIVLGVILLYPSQLRDRFISTITVNLFNQGQRYEGKTLDQQLRSKLNIPTLAVKTSSNSAYSSTFATESGVATDITPGEPLDSTQLGVYRSFQIRFNIEWPRAINAFLKNPFLGTGYSSIGIATDNDFLRSLGEVGLLGTAAFCLVLMAVSKEIFKLIRGDDKFIKFLSIGVLSMIVAFVINGLFIDVFEASKIASLFWMIIGLNLAAFNFQKEK